MNIYRGEKWGVKKMKDGFYRSTSVILSMAGFVISICLYFVHDFLYDRLRGMFWLILLLVNVCSGALIGALIKSLHQGANKDPLTGLQNRRCFYDRIDYEIEKMKRTKLPLSLAFIDIDNFKIINDTYGHLEGDKVLVELAQIFKTQGRSGDTIVRWGGEEFAMILPETDKMGALALAERVRRLVESSNCNYRITICIGITTVYHERDVEKIMSIADRALYKAKENKNMVVFLTE